MHKYDLNVPEGHFKVLIIPKVDFSDSNGRETVIKNFSDKIKSNFNFIEDCRNSFYISINELDKFFNMFWPSNEICWTYIFLEENIDWTSLLLKIESKKIDWTKIHENTSIKFNFQIIEIHKDYINWPFISSLDYLPWNVELLKKYFDYIYFDTYGNLKGDKELWVENCMSSTLLNCWTYEFIFEAFNEWNWDKLSFNTSIAWDKKLIDAFSNKLSFYYLSGNTNVKWSEDLIDKYFDKWSWDNLSLNPSLPWSEQLIKKYQDKWKWDFYGRNISQNTGITWNKNIGLLFQDKIDFMEIAKNGKHEDDFIISFFEKFNEFRFNQCSGLRNSDGFPMYYRFYNGWQMLKQNQNFIMSENLRNKLSNKFCRIIDFSVDDYEFNSWPSDYNSKLKYFELHQIGKEVEIVSLF